MAKDREATAWGLADYLNHVYFVSDIDVSLDGRSETLRSFWRTHYPDMVRWFDGPAPLYLAAHGVNDTYLWVKDSWLNQ